MSLVNQMLKDLEQRRADLPRGDSLRGLHAASAEPAPQRNPWPTLLIAAALGGVGYGWWLTFAQPGMAVALASAPVVTDTHSIAPAPVKMKIATAEPAASLSSADVDAAWDKTWEPRTAEAVAIAALEETSLDTTEYPAIAAAPVTPAPIIVKTPTPRPAAIVSTGAAIGTAAMHKTIRAATPAELATQHYNDALAALRTGNSTHSEALLRSALEQSPGHIAAAETLAAVLLQQQRGQDAENILINALAVTPTEPRLLKLHARILADAGRDSEAVALLQAPGFVNDAESQALLGALQQRLGNDVLAASAYRQALLRAPQRGAWWLGLAISLERSQQPGDALAAYRRALSDRALGTQITTYVRGRIAVLDNGQG